MLLPPLASRALADAVARCQSLLAALVPSRPDLAIHVGLHQKLEHGFDDAAQGILVAASPTDRQMACCPRSSGPPVPCELGWLRVHLLYAMRITLQPAPEAGRAAPAFDRPACWGSTVERRASRDQ